ANQTITATVNSAAISFANQIIGKDLQVLGSLGLDAPAPTGGLNVVITSTDSKRVLLSNSATALGSGQITVPFSAGSFGPASQFFIQALDGAGTVDLTASAPGFATRTATVTLTPSGFLLNPGFIGSFTTTALSANQQIQIISVRLTTN